MKLTIGLVYIFKSELFWAGRLFWFVVIVSMLCLGFYWSWYLYAGDYCVQNIFMNKKMKNDCRLINKYQLRFYCFRLASKPSFDNRDNDCFASDKCSFSSRNNLLWRYIWRIFLKVLIKFFLSKIYSIRENRSKKDTLVKVILKTKIEVSLWHCKIQ